MALTATTPLADEQVTAQLVLRQAFTKGHIGLQFSFRLRTDHRTEAGVRWCQTLQEPLVRGGTGPRQGRAYGTGTAQVGQVSVLLLTLAAGQGRVEGRLGVDGVYSMRVAVIMGVEKPGLGRRFQRHGPVHIVIVGPDGTYLVERQHLDLLEVQPVQLHPEGVSRIHPGEPGWVAPGRGAPNAHGTSDKPETQRQEGTVVSDDELYYFLKCVIELIP